MEASTRPADLQRRHVFDLDDFSRAEIEQVLDTAESMKEVLSREIKQVPTLRGKTITNVFYQELKSTRISFEMAARALSANVVNFTEYDGGFEEGHSLIGMARVIQSLGADILVLRHAHAGTPYLLAQHFEGSVINAGDGSHANPSQALLDLFTIREKLQHLDDVRVVMVGDILHSDVARSHLWGLSRTRASVTLCAPPTLIGPTHFWLETWPDIRISYDLNDAIEDADVVIVLPVHRDRYQSGMVPSLREYMNFFALTSERLKLASPDVLVLQPGAMSSDIEITPEVIAAHRTTINEQATNGIAVRMALLYLLTGA